MLEERLEDNIMAYPLYRMRSIRSFTVQAGSSGEAGLSESYGLIVCCGGSGQLTLDGKMYRLKDGAAFIAPPLSLLAVRARTREPLHMMTMAFEEIGAPSDLPSRFLCTGYVEPPPDLQLAHELQALRDDRSAAEPIGQLERHMRFERLLLAILKHNGAPDSRQRSARRLVDGTLELIHNGYNETLRVDRLALSCNISTRHYTRIFTELTGKSPLDYLSELRIGQSVHELVASGGRLKDVARKAGYADSDYYSKRFKEKMGMSPSRYMLNWRKAPRIVALQCAGDLLALGIKPVGMMTNGLSGPLRGYINEIPTLDHDFGAIAGTIAPMKPDLIVAGDYMSAEWTELLSKIAPTVAVQWTGIGPLYHLNMLSQILDREKERRQWLTRYEAKREELSRKLAAVNPDRRKETAAVFYMWRDQIRTFAPHVFPTFYEVLGYDMPSWFTGWSDRDKRLGSTQVTFDSFSAFAADHMFVIVQDQAALEACKRLTTTYKSTLPAIARNRLQLLEPDWYSIDATSLYWQLQSAELLP